MLDSGTLEISVEDELNVGGVSFIDCQFTVFIPLKAIAGTGVVFRFAGGGAVPQTQFDVIAASLILCLIESLNDRKDMFRGRISGIEVFQLEKDIHATRLDLSQADQHFLSISSKPADTLTNDEINLSVPAVVEHALICRAVHSAGTTHDIDIHIIYPGGVIGPEHPDQFRDLRGEAVHLLGTTGAHAGIDTHLLI